MPEGLQRQEKYLLARNDWHARHLLKRIKRGDILPVAHFFDSEKEAYRRRSNMRPLQQSYYTIFKVTLNPSFFNKPTERLN